MSATVLTVGSFSILHPDHVALFKFCRKLAGLEGTVYVGVNDDSMIEKDKGFRPQIPVHDRLDMIMEFQAVNFSFKNLKPEIQSVIEELSADYLVIGSDWHSKDYLSRIGSSFDQLAEVGCALVYYPSRNRYHSSDLRSGCK